MTGLFSEILINDRPKKISVFANSPIILKPAFAMLKPGAGKVCLITSRKPSHQYFEFSLKVKMPGLNPGYLLKSFLLYTAFNGSNNDKR